MTVPANAGRNDYTGDGTTTVFPYTFRILDQAHVKVIYDGTVQTLSTHYTVSGVGVAGGGNITFVNAPVSAKKVAIIREVPTSQLVDFIDGDAFPAASAEDAIDALTMAYQQLLERFNRTPSLDPKETLTGVKLPAPVASQFLRWNSGATQLESVDGNPTTPQVTINSVDVFTNKTYDVEAAGNVLTVVEKLYLRAAKTAGATAETLFDTPTANAPAATAEGAAPMTHASLGFDATTDETCIIPWLVPAGWAGQVDIALHWHAAAVAGAVTWRIETAGVGAASVIAPSFNAIQYTASQTVDAVANATNVATKTNITTTGFVAGELAYIRIGRDADGTGGTDDMTGDALLDVVEITYRRTM